jgi:hypothetical protein
MAQNSDFQEIKGRKRHVSLLIPCRQPRSWLNQSQYLQLTSCPQQQCSDLSELLTWTQTESRGNITGERGSQKTRQATTNSDEFYHKSY